MAQRKAPLATSVPIARLRAAGCKVSTGINHNPTGSLQFNRLAYRVTTPTGDVYNIDERGIHVANVVARLNRIAEVVEGSKVRRNIRAVTIRKGDDIVGLGVAQHDAYTPTREAQTAYGKTHTWVTFGDNTEPTILSRNTIATIKGA